MNNGEKIYFIILRDLNYSLRKRRAETLFWEQEYSKNGRNNRLFLYLDLLALLRFRISVILFL